MKEVKIEKWTRVKSWDQLEKECKGLTSLICEQDFNATRQDVMDDNLDSDLDEVDLKLETMFRMLDENLDYGKYNETEEEFVNDRLHSALLNLRCTIT